MKILSNLKMTHPDSKRKWKSTILFVFMILIFKSGISQVGTLTGKGHDCNWYSFSICPGQTITPLNYQNYTEDCLPHNSFTDISFATPGGPGNSWRVNSTNYTYSSTCASTLVGFNQSGTPISNNIPTGYTLSPVSYTVFGITPCVQFNISTSWYNMNTFSISLSSSFCGGISPNSFTYCANTGTNVTIYPVVSGGPFSFTWQPGPAYGNSIVVNPTVNTVYTVSTITGGGCNLSTTVAVTASTCPIPPCCIGAACTTITPGGNPLNSSWRVPLNGFNYVFSGAGGNNNRVGIGTNCNPANKLEITSDPSVPYGNLITPNGASGLRLTNLTWNKTPLSNGGNKGVLSVDGNGDVIYVQGSASTLGNYCNNTSNPVTGDYEIPLTNQWNFNFTTPTGSFKGKVQIGQPACSVGPARLNTYDDASGQAIFGYCNSNGINNVGVHGQSTFSLNTGNEIGVLGDLLNLNSASGNAGVAGYVCTSGSPIPMGVNTGVYGNNCGNTSYWAAYFEGPSYTTLGYWSPSDRHFKKDINKLENVTAKIKNLYAYTFFYNTTDYKNKNFDENKHFGFIAQELKEIFPEMVKEDSKGNLAVEYDAMIPVLLQAIKEQQQQIDELKNLVKASNTNDKQSNNQSVDLSDKNTIVLDQNVPNPFAESTVINYNIPTDFTKAQIIFSTNEGKVIRSVDISVKGPGKLTVFANDLSSGMYIYTLVVDGKTIDTKKMVKQ
jgi:hypothetical protein